MNYQPKDYTFRLDQTKAYLDFYQLEGFCVIDNVYSKDEVDEIEAFFENYREVKQALFNDGKSYEEIDPGKELLRAMHPHRYHQRPLDWMMHKNIVEVLHHLFGKEPLGAQTMYYYKPPKSVGQGMHQDNMYLLAAPVACAAAWTPIDDADEENGCLSVIPHSHGNGIYCKEGKMHWQGLKTHMSALDHSMKPLTVPVRRGQTMFFHGELPHGSGPNRSKTRSRRTFIGHYCNEATEEISKFYHPILNTKREVVSDILEYAGGGPCGDGWVGALH